MERESVQMAFIATAVVLPASMGTPGLMWLIIAYILYGAINRE